MQRFTVAAAVGHPEGGDLRAVRPVVDAAADHAMLPASLLAQLDLSPQERMLFALADGRRAEYGIGTARFALTGRERPCPVVFGPDNRYLLGASTLEIFNLAVDPVGQCLRPEELLSLGGGGLLEDAAGRPPYPVAVEPRPGYRIWLRYSDGVSGEVDLSPLAGKGGIATPGKSAFFPAARLDLDRAIVLNEDLELCPDALYLQLIGQSAAAMPGLTS